MRVGLLMAGFLLTSAIASLAVTLNMSPPAPAKTQAPAKAPTSAPAKVTCPCDCPKGDAAGQPAQAHRAPRRVAHHHARGDYAERSYYRYSAAAPVIEHAWHGQWRVAPNDATIPGPHHGYSRQEVQVDSRGWTGGVGYAPDGGFVDGYGQVHFAGGFENGPTYNSYHQSFQYNPSHAGPFQPRSMGGYAPPHR